MTLRLSYHQTLPLSLNHWPTSQVQSPSVAKFPRLQKGHIDQEGFDAAQHPLWPSSYLEGVCMKDWVWGQPRPGAAGLQCTVKFWALSSTSQASAGKWGAQLIPTCAVIDKTFHSPNPKASGPSQLPPISWRVLGIESMTLHMLGNHSITKLYPQASPCHTHKVLTKSCRLSLYSAIV